MKSQVHSVYTRGCRSWEINGSNADWAMGDRCKEIAKLGRTMLRGDC